MLKSLLPMVIALTFLNGPLALAAPNNPYTSNVIEELNPFDPNIEQTLEELDRIYEEETGLSPFLEDDQVDKATCKRKDCKIWIRVSKSDQSLTLYIDGWRRGKWDVSTGVAGYGTPNFDRHPNGRIYNRYTSTRYPGGDWRGLGNMPYAIFIQGGFALHGTPQGNWSRLGTRASHGCIRMHPDNAQQLNLLVRKYGIYKTWITVEN